MSKKKCKKSLYDHPFILEFINHSSIGWFDYCKKEKHYSVWIRPNFEDESQQWFCANHVHNEIANDNRVKISTLVQDFDKQSGCVLIQFNYK